MWQTRRGRPFDTARAERFFVGLLVCWSMSLHASDQLTSARAGAAITMTVPVPVGVMGPVHFAIEPAFQDVIAEPHRGYTTARELTLRATVPVDASPGVLILGTVKFTDGSGHEATVAARILVDEEGDDAAISVDVRALAAPVGHLPATAYVGLTELGASGRSETGLGIDVRGRARSDTQVKASFIRGWNPGVAAVYRYGMHASRGELELRNPRWAFAAGELSADTSLAGIRTVADGISYERTAGQILGSATFAKPKYYAGGWAGHLAQGSIGVSLPGGSLVLTGADISRPVARSSVVVSIPASSIDALEIEEDLERLGRLFSREDRLQALGVEGRVRKSNHLVIGRTGLIELVGPSGARSRGPVGDISYSFTTRRGAVNARLRRGPPPVPGTQMSADSTTAGGRLNVAGPITIMARGFASESILFGHQTPSLARGLSGGVEYAKDVAHLQLEGNYRESRLITLRTIRSLTARARWLFGPVLVDANGEYGSVKDQGREDPVGSGRMAILYEAAPATVSLSGSYQDYGILPARFSLDLSSGMEWGRGTLEGGVGISKGQLFGDEFHAWAAAEIPLPKQFVLMIGVDYDRWQFESSPFLTFVPAPTDLAEPWRLTLNLQKAFWIDLPFVR